MKKILCGSFTTFDGEYTEWDCKYKHGDMYCDDCICFPFGYINPITGKKLNKIQRYFKFKKDRIKYMKTKKR